ncbi:MAG: FtsQ-type POTRA domain-containing protein [Oscillospiraceae bacterium]|nr:FtsQ-type POTRA domain-containing protein [Oscillospiraceae bacterium]
MAARKNRNRHRRRRGRFGFLYKLLSFLIIFAAILVGCVAFFRVNQVEVMGNSRYSAQQIIDASGVELGDNLFLVNRPQTALNITRELPYVEKVAPVHRPPDTVELHITETFAAAAIQIEDSWWLINASGKLLEQGGESLVGDLPVVQGLHPVDPILGGRLTVELEEQIKLEGLQQLLTALAQREMLGQITEFVDLTAANAIYFGCGGDLTVVVPMSGNFELRVFSLQRVLESFSQRGEDISGTLDLTYGDDQARLLTERWLPAS